MPFLLPWNKSPPHTQLGVGWYNNSIRLVRLSRTNNATPRLDLYKSLLNYKRPTSVLRKFIKRHSLKRIPCVGVMGIGHYQILLTEAPPVLDSELVAATRWQVQELIDFNIEEAIIDVFDVPASHRQEKMIYVVIARKKVVQTHIDNLLGMGFKLTALDIPELAMRNIAALLPEDKEGMALLWLTPKYRMLTITRNTTLYLSRTVEGDINRMVPLIIAEIRRSLTYYENHFNQAPINRLVIAPTSPPLPNLGKYLATHLGINVRLLDLNKLLNSKSRLTAAQQAQCFPILGAALRK
jgi:MSHA biogenesis protein MshI